MESRDGLSYPQPYDFVVKLLAQILRGRSIDFIGTEIGEIADVFALDTLQLAVRSGRIDVIIENRDGDIFHLEEQRNLSKSDLYRFAGYHFLDARQFLQQKNRKNEQKKFTDIVIASGDTVLTEKIETPSGIYKPIIVNLSGRDGRKALEDIRNAVRQGDTERLLELIFVPLYGKEKGAERSGLALEVIAYERELLKAEKIDIRFVAMTLIMSNKIIEKEKLEQLWEEIKMYNIDILDIAREKGMEEGVLKDAREMVIEALTERFVAVPSDIKRLVSSLGKHDLLKELHRYAIRSSDIEAFRKVLSKVSSAS